MTLYKHYVATAYIYDKQTDSFLLIFHKKLGKWLPPGGHLDEGEEPGKGALREVSEEIGVEGQIIDLLETPRVETRAIPQLSAPFCMLSETIPASPQEGEHIHIDFVYVVEIDLSQPLDICQEEVSLARWFSSGEISRLETYENVKQVCQAISSISQAKKRDC
ncbi:MAG TPA: NUDIX domain-containing protein [Ktedonobacteraceae bacterium]|nr:NUDIX domain-containing protein [Ktedonobacteraceae bacterium]